MKDRQTPLTKALQDYLYQNFSAEDDLLKDIAQNCWIEESIPQINITGYQANFLQFLIKSINAKNILEIGTLAGYSAIVMARASSPEAKILTIEKQEKHALFAQQKIAEAGLSDKIEVKLINAHKFVKRFAPEEKLDFIFLDADKAAYFKYFEGLAPHLRQGGMIVADNAFAFGYLLDSAPEKKTDEIRSMLGFHKYVLERKDFFTTLVPIGDGMLISLKK